MDTLGRPQILDRLEEEIPPPSSDLRGEKQHATIIRAPAGWPELDAAALVGLPGDIVRTIEPRTEADPVAVLIQTLVAFGNAVGLGPRFLVEADRHPMNLFTVLVGDTSRARKGTSFGRVFYLFERAAPDWANEDHIVSGLSSGEGLIYAVRDAEILSGDDVGVEDKRLLVHEPEFASVLKVMNREGNTLSPLIRQAWDSRPLRTLTRNAPIRSTGAHVSLIGHVTLEELRRHFNSTEAANGFGNRFLWMCVSRSKLLPEGGGFCEAELEPLINRLSAAIKFARDVGILQRDPETREMWASVYPRLTEAHPGLFGSIVSRSEAQVVRLACVFALMNMSSVILPSHLMAALAVWEFAEASARLIFGGSSGDPVADRLLEKLVRNQQGLSRTDLSNTLGRHVPSVRLDQALVRLEREGLISKETHRTGGRPSEIWRASTPPENQRCKYG